MKKKVKQYGQLLQQGEKDRILMDFSKMLDDQVVLRAIWNSLLYSPSISLSKLNIPLFALSCGLQLLRGFYLHICIINMWACILYLSVFTHIYSYRSSYPYMFERTQQLCTCILGNAMPYMWFVKKLVCICLTQR